MGTFAKIGVDNLVEEVILADQDFIDSEAMGDPSSWVETSFDGEFRKQYAGKGYTYDKVNDVFISQQPYPSWTLDASFDWQPPTAMPIDDKKYYWDELTLSWNEITLS